MKSLTVFIIIYIIPVFLFAGKDFTKQVNPFVGTAGHGHTFPGATRPFGMVQLSPDTGTEGWDWCSGYHSSDSSIIGFSHTHLSGTGGADYGDILLMPFNGKAELQAGTKANPNSGYRSRFKHATEKAEPGYYSVYLEDYNIFAELTTTERVGFHKYTFINDQPNGILIDLDHGISDRTVECFYKLVDDSHIEGYRFSSGWAKDQKVFFSLELSQPVDSIQVKVDDKMGNAGTAKGKKAVIALYLKNNNSNELFVKVGISFVSIEGAQNNLMQEIPHWDFKKILEESNKSWNEKLSLIEIEGGTKDQQTTFYTALYHTMIHPNLFSDVAGKYRGMDGKVYSGSEDHYTLFSLWDTYRATHPLYNIILPDLNNAFIRSLLDKYKTGGILPIWELAANYTGTMIGYHAIPVIVDAYIKGVHDFDEKLAMEAMIHSAMQDHLGLEYYKESGFIPFDIENESVSRVLEYAYDDWCIAHMAKQIGDEKIYQQFIERSLNYINVFDSSTGFMRGKDLSGIPESPFDPSDASPLGSGSFTEANSWQYSWHVPQDVNGLIDLFGGDNAFNSKLDDLFSMQVSDTDNLPSDVTGLIGQYAHGNEPSHHVAYLYNFSGQPWKTQRLTRKIMDELYSLQRDGLCGNEDCGQMSAWYVFSALGFYPVTPGSNDYIIGSPLFDKATIKLPNGKKFTIRTTSNSTNTKYIQSAKMNDQIYDKSYFTYADILSQKNLTFLMEENPNYKWAVKNDHRPRAEIDQSNRIVRKKVLMPHANTNSFSFNESYNLQLSCLTSQSQVYYTLDGKVPDENFEKYNTPIKIDKTTQVKAIGYRTGWQPSRVFKATFIKAATFDSLLTYPKIKLKYPPRKKYSAQGAKTLIDGVRAGKQFLNGKWLGFNKSDFEVIIDLGKQKQIQSITATFLNEQGAWIFLPQEVIISVSKDGDEYFEKSNIKINSQKKDSEIKPIDFKTTDPNISARYIKVFAKKMDVLPDWHIGAGHKAWIFIDEIIIEYE